MSKRKGLSLDEKRSKLLEVFHETADVFVLKDVEKLGMKKGITGQSIKEVLQSLVDDDIVRQEKIGASNYFWSFPADASVKLANELAKVEQEVAACKRRKAELSSALETQKSGKEATAQRAELQAAMAALQGEVDAAHATLAAYRDQDPETLKAMREGAAVATAAANRWLDNTHCLLSWCKRQFPGQEKSLDEFFAENGFSDALEYLG